MTSHPIVHYPKEDLTEQDCWYHSTVMLLGLPQGPNAGVNTNGVVISPDGSLDARSENVRAFAGANNLQLGALGLRELTFEEISALLQKAAVMVFGASQWVNGKLPVHAFVVAGVDSIDGANMFHRYDSDLPQPVWQDWDEMGREWAAHTVYVLQR